jgi:hypothetical protein
MTARRAWLEPADVLNTLPLEDLRRRLRRGGYPASGDQENCG